MRRHTARVNSPRDLRAVEQVLALPLHRLLELHLVDPDDPAAGVALEVGEHSVNPAGVLHGGLVPLLLDVACFLAVLPRLPGGSTAVTVSTTASLLAPVARGATVHVRGEVTRLGRSLVYCTASAHDVDRDRVSATGQVVKAVVAPS